MLQALNQILIWIIHRAEHMQVPTAVFYRIGSWLLKKKIKKKKDWSIFPDSEKLHYATISPTNFKENIYQSLIFLRKNLAPNEQTGVCLAASLPSQNQKSARRTKHAKGAPCHCLEIRAYLLPLSPRKELLDTSKGKWTFGDSFLN